MNKKKQKRSTIFCSFCDKGQYEVDLLISGQHVMICNECIELCYEIIIYTSREKQAKDIANGNIPTPIEINEVLNDFIVYQNEAKKILSVAVHNHYKRLQILSKESDIKISKSNVLLIGPSGSGKTLLADTLARILNVPITIVDATTFTEAGYVGEDVENMVQKLLQQSDYDIDRTEKGIIYIDEIDKICRKNDMSPGSRDVSGEGVQQALLKLIEGTIASVPPQGGRRHPNQELLQIDTSEILFICGGTFTGIEKIISQRLNKSGIGFSANLKNENLDLDILKHIEPSDLAAYGLIPEFIGRLPIVCALKALEEKELADILIKPRNALIKQYIKLFSLDGVELEFSQDALIAIAKKTQQRNTGARGLRAILEKILLNTMYIVPSIKKKVKKVIIDACVIDNNSEPIIIYKGKKK